MSKSFFFFFITQKYLYILCSVYILAPIIPHHNVPLTEDLGTRNIIIYIARDKPLQGYLIPRTCLDGHEVITAGHATIF